MILLMNVDKDNPSVAEGESVQIQGAGLTGFEPKGNTEQTTYTGKNLFDINSITEGKFYYIDQNRIVDNANWNMSDYIKVNGNTNYIASYIKSTNYSQLNYSYYDENKNLLGGVGAASNTDNYSILTPANAYYIRLGYRNNGDYILSNIQLEQGSSATSYEPYCGGTPSPSPDYPQNVKVVTGDNEIVVCGKNLCNNNYLNLALNYLDNKIISDASSRTMYAKVPKNTDITISKTNVTNRFRVGLLNKIPEAQDTFYLAYKNDNSSTLTTTINTGNYEYVAVQYTNQSQNTNLMIEKGSTASAYEEYQSQTYSLNLGSIELCKIGTYQDYIYKENNKWYKHSEIEKLNVDTSTITIRSNYTNIEYAEITKPNDFIGKGNYDDYNVYCSHAISDIKNAIQYAWDSTYRIGKITNKANTGNFWLGFPKGTGLDNIKTALNGAVIYYALATSTDTEITDTDLIEDLEAISNIALFEGVNNISMESSNLTSSFKVYYDTWYEFDKILRNGYNIREDRDRITQKFANGHRKQFVSDYVDCSITLNLDTIDKDTTQDYLQRLKSGAYKYYSIDGKEYRTAQFIIENKPELSVESSISNNVDVNEYQITLLKAGD